MIIQAMSISSPTLAASLRRRQAASRKGLTKLSSPFLWSESRISARVLWQIVNRFSRKQVKMRKMEIVDELGGQYEYTFNDVKLQIRNYFTFKAVRTVLQQLYEMNPSEYTWFYNYIATNRPGEGKRFLQALTKVFMCWINASNFGAIHVFLGNRKDKFLLKELWLPVCIYMPNGLRYLELFVLEKVQARKAIPKHIKICDHEKIYKEISDENLELMRERLMETVIWPVDDVGSGSDSDSYE